MKIVRNVLVIGLQLVTVLASWTLLFLFLFGYNFIEINLIGNKEIYVNIGTDYFENGFKCSFLGIDLTDKVKVDNLVNTQVLGESEVSYNINLLFYHKSVFRTVYVVDNESPTISLYGDTTLYVEQYSDYEEPGYKAIDGYDGNITDEVVINDNIDTSKIGTYEVTYTVTDSSNNSYSISRSVEVVSSSVLSQPLNKFWLKGLFTNVTLEAGSEYYDYLDDAVFVGDSNIRYLYMHGKYLKAKQVWGRNNLTAVDINTAKVTIHQNNKEMTIDEAVDTYKPKYLIVSFGMRSAFLTKDAFVSNAEKFISNFLNNHPDTKLIIMSIPPVTLGTTSVDTQSKLNKVNYYALELCSKYKVGFINIADELRDSSGYGKSEYLLCDTEEDCGFHLSNEGKKVFVDYMKRVNLEKEIS